MKRKMDGIRIRIRHGYRTESVCLSDMSEEELHAVLADKDVDWMENAIIHLAKKLREVGDAFDIEGE